MAKHMPPIQKRLIDAAVEIRQEDSDEIIYQHGIFAQVGLPRSKQQGRTFERKFKNASIEIEAGKLWLGGKWVEQPLPYGPKPRLALIHLNSEAIRTQSPQIEIGRSVSEFLRRIGLPDQDGRAYNMFKRQMMALAAATLSIGFTIDGVDTTLRTIPIEEFKAWIVNNEKQGALWPGELTLSRSYFESLKAHAVPLDPRAVGALSHSALALDWYSFLSRRLYQLNRPVKLPFLSLQEQFGQEYTSKTSYQDFKKEFLKVNKQVLAVYPEAIVKQVIGGLVLNPSHPPVKAITKSRRIAKEALKVLPSHDTTGNLTERTLERFRELWPRLDVYACKTDFDQWVSGKTQKPIDYNRAFFGFSKKWAKKQSA